jgi:hypothetical protein
MVARHLYPALGLAFLSVLWRVVTVLTRIATVLRRAVTVWAQTEVRLRLRRIARTAMIASTGRSSGIASQTPSDDAVPLSDRSSCSDGPLADDCRDAIAIDYFPLKSHHPTLICKLFKDFDTSRKTPRGEMFAFFGLSDPG